MVTRPLLKQSAATVVQAMAGFGGDTADDPNSVFLGDDTAQQTFLTTPQPACNYQKVSPWRLPSSPYSSQCFCH
jgi:hypothetical protein